MFGISVCLAATDYKNQYYFEKFSVARFGYEVKIGFGTFQRMYSTRREQ